MTNKELFQVQEKLRNEPSYRVVCLICNKYARQIHGRHVKTHNLTLKEYKEKFPECEIYSEQLKDLRKTAYKNVNTGRVYGKEHSKRCLEGQREGKERRGGKRTQKSIDADEKRRQWSLKNNPFKGKHHTKETIDYLSNKHREDFASGKRKNWTEGYTKETHPSIAQAGKAISKALIGKPTWLKGLTKETDHRVAKMAEQKRLNPPLKPGSPGAKIISRKRKERLKDPYYAQKWKESQLKGLTKAAENPYNKTSAIELMLQKELDKRFIKYQVHKQFQKYHTIPDLFIEPNVVIYADGDYWHGTKEAKEKDSQQTYALKTHGYEVVRLWEHEIHKDVSACVDFIELHMNQTSNIEQREY